MSGWTMVSHYQEESAEAMTESVPMLPQPVNGYQPAVMYMNHVKYLPVTNTFFVLKRAHDQVVRDLQFDLDLARNNVESLRKQIEELESDNAKHVDKEIELAKECNRLAEIVAEPKVQVEQFGLLSWSSEIRRIYKTVRGVDCGVGVRFDGSWSAQAFDGKNSSEAVIGKVSAEEAAEDLLVSMRKQLRDHIDRKKAELDELATIENVAAVAMVEPKEEKVPF